MSGEYSTLAALSETHDLHQSLKNVKQKETSPREAKPREPCVQVDIDLPEPEHRSVAGHVRRNAGGRPNALPAPSNNSTGKRPLNRRDFRRLGKLDKGQDGDGESDSDDDHRRPSRTDSSPNTITRKRNQLAGSDETLAVDSAKALREQEEMERLQILRSHHKNAQLIGKIRQLREANKKEATGRMRQSQRHTPRLLSTEYLDKIRKENDRLGIYIDDSQYGDLELNDRFQNIGHRAFLLGDLRAIARRVQHEILDKCSYFYDKTPRPESASTVFSDESRRNLMAIFQAMQQELKKCCDHVGPGFSVKNWLIECDCAYWMDENETPISKIAKKVLEKTTKDMIKKCRVYWSQKKSEPDSLEICNLIEAINNDDCCKTWNDYLDYMFRDLPTSPFESPLLEWHRSGRCKKTPRLREDFFFLAWSSDLEEPLGLNGSSGDVYLVSFKGNSIESAQVVASAVLQEIGWRTDDGERYWRYERCGSNVFKMSMDGELMGVLTDEHGACSGI